MNRIATLVCRIAPISLVFLSACLNPAPVVRAPPPVPVELRLMHKDFVPRPLQGRWDSRAALAGPGDELWLFAADRDGVLQVARRTGGKWSAWENLGEPSWCFPHFALEVAPDAEGRPVVIGIGRDCTGEGTQPAGTFSGSGTQHYWGDSVVLATRWTGAGWTPFLVLDRFQTTYGPGGWSCLRDTRGSIHVVYDRPLYPREDYLVGYDGVFPDKIAHLVYDGQNWSKPRFTTGRGLFSLVPGMLSEGPRGLVLVCSVRDWRFFCPTKHVDYQVFEGGSWSGLTRVVAGAVSSYSVAADHWGNRLIGYCPWTPGYDPIKNPPVMYLEPPAGGRRPLPPEMVCEEPVVTTDAAGRIALLTRAENKPASLRIWNGAAWSKELAGLPAGYGLYFGCSHSADRLLLVERGQEGFALYEIAVEGLAPRRAGSQPHGDTEGRVGED